MPTDPAAAPPVTHLTTLSIDLDGRRLQAGADAADVLGFALADGALDAAALRARIAPHDRERVGAAVREALAAAEGSGRIALDVLADDGTLRRLECAWWLDRGADGGARIARLACAHVPAADETTARLEAAEQQLRHERERLELALDAGQMGAFDLDIPRDVLWWSPGMYRIFGVDQERFVPTREGVLELMHPDDRTGFVRARVQAIADRKPYVHEFRALRPDGRIAWIWHTGRTEYDAGGRPVRTYGITMDVTERRLQEEALREADRQKDRFIATLAHELRNPLAPIRNAVELLRRLAAEDTRLAWYGDVIDRQVTHMSHLLDDLLDVSRITRGTIRLRRRTLAVSGAIEQAVEVATPMITSLGHRLQVDVPEAPLHVDADPMRLAQVFSNLLLNAAKYTPAHGRITVTARAQGRDAVVSVADDGLGIAPEQLPRLFEMFGQVDAGLERSQSGLGIGLWLAHALVEMHGGRLEARSEGVGRGSEFIVRLPLAAAREASPPVERRRGAPARQPLTVLIADDKADIADSLATLLRLEGHTVHVAYGGDEAIAAARRHRPDVAVLDLGMPGTDGYAVCRALRAEPWGAGVTLVAQTGWGLAEHRRRAREAGFDHHIVKPVDPKDLLELLQPRRAHA